MAWAALVTWIFTVGGGSVLLGIWLRQRGHRQERDPGLRIRPSLLASHLSLGTLGLVLWILYLALDVHELVWVGFDIAVIASLLGLTMFSIWLRQRANAAERNFPIPVVAVHGALAAATVALTLATALEA